MRSVDELVDVVLGGSGQMYSTTGDSTSMVRAVRIDTGEASFPWSAGDLILAVNVDDQDRFDQTISRAKTAGAAAVVVRDVGMETARAGITVIRVQDPVDWTTLYDRFKGGLAAGRGDWLDDTGDDGVQELFALANALGDSIGAAVIIEDRQMRLLAFSEGQSSADPSRIDTILRRRPSEAFIQHFKTSGVATALYRGVEPIYLERTVHIDDEGLPPALHGQQRDQSYVERRAAVGIRAGDRELGAIWVAIGGPLPQPVIDELLSAAKVAALHILRYEAFASRTYQRRRELFTKILWPHPDLIESWSALLQRPGTWFSVVAIRAPRSGAGERWAEDAITAETYFKTRTWNAYFCTFDDICFGIVTTSDAHSRDGVLRAAHGYLTNRRAESAVGVGRWVNDPAELVRSRAEAEAALSVAERRTDGPRACRFGDVQMDALLIAIEQGIDISMYVPSPPLQALLEHDERTGADLVKTLTVYIESLGSVSATAVQLHVHVNTLRHRLGRIEEISGLDFREPGLITRLSLQLYLLSRAR